MNLGEVGDEMRYKDFADFFTDDQEYGQLRDILVSPMSSASWAKFLRWVKGTGLVYYFTIGESDEQVPIPEGVEPLVRFPQDGMPPFCIGLTLGDLKLRMIGPHEEWLELDFWCDSFRPEHFEPLLAFMRGLGEALGQDVRLTPEGQQVAMILYDHAARAIRAPRHGRGADAAFIGELRGKIREIVAPLLGPGGALLSMHLPGHAGAPTVHDLETSIAGRTVIAALARWELEIGSIDQIRVQDQLTPDQQRHLQSLWSHLATFVRDIGSEAMTRSPRHPSVEVRERYWRQVEERVRRGGDVAGMTLPVCQSRRRRA